MKKTKAPVILSVNSNAELAAQDAESYQHLFELKDRTETIEGVKRGLESMKHQRGKAATELHDYSLYRLK